MSEIPTNCLRRQTIQYYYLGVVSKSKDTRYLKAIHNQFVADQYKFADKQKIAEYLHDRGLNPSTATNFCIAHGYETDSWQYRKDRCYTFLASDWMTPDEIQDMNKREEVVNEF